MSVCEFLLGFVADIYADIYTDIYTDIATICFIQRNFRFKHLAVYKFGRCSQIDLAIFDDISNTETEFLLLKKGDYNAATLRVSLSTTGFSVARQLTAPYVLH